MVKIKAQVRGNIKPNRFLKYTVRKDNDPIVRYATDGFPHLHSTAELEDKQEVTISITNKPVWEIEAGEKIEVGEAVYSGEAGKVFARRSGDKRPADLVGYAANRAKKGELVKVVRNFQINGNWAAELSKLMEEELEEPEEPEEPEEGTE